MGESVSMPREGTGQEVAPTAYLADPEALSKQRELRLPCDLSKVWRHAFLHRSAWPRVGDKQAKRLRQIFQPVTGRPLNYTNPGVSRSQT